MYAVTNIEGDFSMSLKVLPEEFEELTTRPNIVPAPYLARHHWVLITNISAFTKPDWEKYILQSYSLVRDKLPPKLRKQLSI
jgi:predicted DNA-binding protein (MmcQ/YjbR family)